MTGTEGVNHRMRRVLAVDETIVATRFTYKFRNKHGIIHGCTGLDFETDIGRKDGFGMGVGDSGAYGHVVSVLRGIEDEHETVLHACAKAESDP